MTTEPIARGEYPIAVRTLLLLVGAAALIAGLYGRFKGIGTWPLGVDEFYISRSIDNILRSGLPAFPCGGYYTRGLIYQYAVAALRLCGWSPEFAGRFVAGTSSLLVLPAVFLLGKRMQGSLAGWLAVIILCVSVWEIEMARFARMYAPFQAVFAWYLLAYLRFTVDRHAAALWWMAGLSVLGVLTWEGGVLLGVASIFAVLLAHDNERLTRMDWIRMAALCVLLGLLYLATRDLRGFADPPGADAAAIEAPTPPLHFAAAWFAQLWRHPVFAAGLLVPLTLVVPALRWIGGFRDRWLACAGLCLALLAAALHAFLATGAILVLMLLMRIIYRQDLAAPRARYFWMALGAFFLFWLAIEAMTGSAPAATAEGPAGEIMHRLFGLPDVLEHVLRPWARTVPVLSLGLFAAISFLSWRAIAAQRPAIDAQRAAIEPLPALLSLVIVLVLAVGSTPAERIETRYTFFLYPLLILLAVCAILSIARRRDGLRSVPILAAAALPLVCFAATEDFQPRHIRDVDSEKINFRVGMPRHRAEHYYPRNDIRGAGQWLAAQVRPGDVVISGIASLDQYYGGVDYFFLDETDPRYETYVCPDGRTERWSNKPVLYTTGALAPIVASGHRVFASLFASAELHLKNHAASASWSVTRVWTAASGTASVDLIVAQPEAAHAQ